MQSSAQGRRTGRSSQAAEGEGKPRRIADTDRGRAGRHGGESPADEDWSKHDRYGRATEIGIKRRPGRGRAGPAAAPSLNQALVGLAMRHQQDRKAVPELERRFDLGQSPTRKAVVALLAVTTVILSAAALRASAVVTMPVAFAFFVAVLVHPIEKSVASLLPRRLPWLSIALSMLLVVSVVAVAVVLVWLTLLPVIQRAPSYVQQFQDKVLAWNQWAQQLGVSLPASFDLQSIIASSGVQSLVWGLTSAGEVLAFLVLVFFFTLLMLLEASAWRRKTEAALRWRHTTMVLETIATVAHKVRRFVALRTVISLIAAVTEGGWLWLMGVDFAPFWGVLIFLLNYLPNIGSIISAIPPALLAFVQFGFGWALVVVAGFTAIDQVIGNFLDPRLLGRSLNVSSLVVLLAVIFWGWIWGVVGALIAVPLTVTILAACANVPALRPIAVLLSGGENGDRTDPSRD